MEDGMEARTPAGRLVLAFGNPAAMSSLYSPDVQWSLSASLTQFPRPIEGKDAVVAFNESIWHDVYHPDCETEILDEVGDDEISAVRFIYRATFVRSGVEYENEYTLFVRSGREGILAVFEGLDTAALLDALTGMPVGSSFRQNRPSTDD
jgi:ketosteroid isomerase-like protein